MNLWRIEFFYILIIVGILKDSTIGSASGRIRPPRTPRPPDLGSLPLRLEVSAPSLFLVGLKDVDGKALQTSHEGNVGDLRSRKVS